MKSIAFHKESDARSLVKWDGFASSSLETADKGISTSDPRDAQGVHLIPKGIPIALSAYVTG